MIMNWPNVMYAIEKWPDSKMIFTVLYFVPVTMGFMYDIYSFEGMWKIVSGALAALSKIWELYLVEQRLQFMM